MLELQPTDTVAVVTIALGDPYCFVLNDQTVDACENCAKHGTPVCNIHVEDERCSDL